MTSYQKVSEAQIQALSEAEIRQRLRELWPISSAGCAPRIGAIKEVFRLQAELERRTSGRKPSRFGRLPPLPAPPPLRRERGVGSACDLRRCAGTLPAPV